VAGPLSRVDPALGVFSALTGPVSRLLEVAFEPEPAGPVSRVGVVGFPVVMPAGPLSAVACAGL
jgi:hypothetical protein